MSCPVQLCFLFTGAEGMFSFYSIFNSQTLNILLSLFQESFSGNKVKSRSIRESDFSCQTATSQ